MCFRPLAKVPSCCKTDPKWLKIAGTLQRSVDHGQQLVNSIRETKRSSTQAAGVIAKCRAIRPTIIWSACMGRRLRCRRTWNRSWVLAIGGMGTRAGQSAVKCGGGQCEIMSSCMPVKASWWSAMTATGISPDLLPHLSAACVERRQSCRDWDCTLLRSIVEQHGGTVTASDLLTGGAEFRMLLSGAA